MYRLPPIPGAAAILLAGSILFAPVAMGQSGVAPVVAEATIFELPPDTNAGGYDNICVGNLDGFVLTRRAFARFGLPEIPPGATVTRVVYNFTQERVRSMGAGAPRTANLELRRVEGAWVEGEGTLNAASCGGGDDVPGVNWDNAPPVAGAPSAVVFLPTTGNTGITIDTDNGSADDGLIADVQAWVDDPAENYGWEYRITEEDVLDNARRLLPGSMTIFWTAPLAFEDGFENLP